MNPSFVLSKAQKAERFQQKMKRKEQLSKFESETKFPLERRLTSHVVDNQRHQSNSETIEKLRAFRGQRQLVRRELEERVSLVHPKHQSQNNISKTTEGKVSNPSSIFRGQPQQCVNRAVVNLESKESGTFRKHENFAHFTQQQQQQQHNNRCALQQHQRHFQRPSHLGLDSSEISWKNNEIDSTHFQSQQQSPFQARWSKDSSRTRQIHPYFLQPRERPLQLEDDQVLVRQFCQPIHQNVFVLVSTLQQTEDPVTPQQCKFVKNSHCSQEQRTSMFPLVLQAPLVNRNASSNGHQSVRVKDEPFAKLRNHEETVFGREQRRENSHQDISHRPGQQLHNQVHRRQPSEQRLQQLQPFDLRTIKREKPLSRSDFRAIQQNLRRPIRDEGFQNHLKKNEMKSSLNLQTLKRSIHEEESLKIEEMTTFPMKKKCCGTKTWPSYMTAIVTGIVRTYNQAFSRVPEFRMMSSSNDILMQILDISSKFQQFALLQRFVEFED